MNFSVSVDRWREPATPGEIRPGLAPDVLRKAGILSNPADPEQAFRRAKALVQQGHYREARGLLYPHARHASGELRLSITELLARCAMFGGGGDWEQLLSATLAGYNESHDFLGAARTQRDFGDMLMTVGRFRDADRRLVDARELFAKHGDPARAAMVECMRARVRLRAGFIIRAQERLERIFPTLEREADPRTVALVRLDWARILASRNLPSQAARNLLAAERILSSSPGALDRVRARLVRAECLMLLDEPLRAANGLKRLQADVVELEEPAIRAWVHMLLGEALGEADAATARRYLMRARHLYERLQLLYYVARCDIALARVEFRIGLNARGRLRHMNREHLGEWPVLAAQMQIAAAEIDAPKDPERARGRLHKARTFASEAGDCSLIREVDRVLRLSGLVANDEPEPAPEPARLVVQEGTSEMPATLHPLPTRKPEPFPVGDLENAVLPGDPSANLLQPDALRRLRAMLKPPRLVTGVRRP